MLESAAFLLGIVNVTLVVRRSVWNFPFGIAMVALYAVVFARARLYSDMLLQGFFLIVNAYGWASWSRQRADRGEVVVTTMPPRERVGWAGGWLVATLAWGTAMARWTDAAYPGADAAIAMASMAAQVMMARRFIENWVVWIAVDSASIALYAAKGLWLTMVLYAILLVLSLWGLADWRAAYRRPHNRQGAVLA